MEELLSKIVALIGMAFILSVFFAYPVMWCWNAVVPMIWQLPVITAPQAWCLMFLAKVLLKSDTVMKPNN